jgi:hypothetical protein
MTSLLPIFMRVIQKVETASTCMLLAHFAWDVSFHPPYSPDLAESDFDLFIHLKQFLGGMSMGSDGKAKKGSMDWWQISMMQAYGNSSHNMGA